MGFDHQLKVDIAIARRAEIALENFRIWALSNDDSEVVGESWKIGAFHTYDSVEEKVVSVGEGGPVQVRDYFPQRVWPLPGEGLIHWLELPFLDYVPLPARDHLYQELDSQDALPVWYGIKQAWEEAYKRWEQSESKYFRELGFPVPEDPEQ